MSMNANETSIARARIHSLARSLARSLDSCKRSTHGVDLLVYTVFMVNAAKKTMYTPWVNAMSGAFTRIEWSKKISNLSEVWILNKVQFFSESVYIL